MSRCTATSKKTGKQCTRPAMAGKAVCYHHGGKAGRPVEHGLYSKYLRQGLAGKLDVAKAQRNPLDATEELHLLRALLTEFLENLTQFNRPVGADEREQIITLTEHISRHVDRIIKQRNETALTTAEVKALRAGMESLINEFVPADRKRDFMQRLRALIPG